MHSFTFSFELIWAVKIVQWIEYAMAHSMMLEIIKHLVNVSPSLYYLPLEKKFIVKQRERKREKRKKLYTLKRWVVYLLPAFTRCIACLFTKVRKLSIWWSTTHNSLVWNPEVFHIKNDCWNIHNYQLLRNHFIWIKNMSHLIYQMLSTVIFFFRLMYWKVIKTTLVSL